MEDGINSAIERAAKDIAWWVRSGLTMGEAVARIFAESTLGPKSWEKVVARAAVLAAK
jgi:hypothetical protein